MESNNTCTCGNDQRSNDQHDRSNDQNHEAELETLRFEITELQFQVESLRKMFKSLQTFSYRHRHQIGASIFSDRGVE